jgi:uncharacterized protein
LELNHDFQVSVPIEHAWAVLTDLERIAPCMPGAQLLEVEGDEYRGVVKVKVGPITAQYKGTAKIVELDPVSHRAVLRAEGRDTKGQGAAAANVTATLTQSDGGTDVHIETDLDISGKVAQFGRGAIGEVSGKILDQFVRDLEATVLSDSGSSTDSDDGTSPSASPGSSGGAGSSGATTVSADSGRRVIESAPAKPVDLLDVAGGSVLKRILPLVLGFAVLGVFRLLRRRRR